MTIDRLHTLHERQFDGSRFVYPVLSRRSGGISVGINLNPDKVCNFDCVYCQVNRVSQSETRFVATEQLLAELDRVLHAVTSQRLFETDKFRATPPPLRHLTDIAFSGDGEPTTQRNFDEIVAACADLRDTHQLTTLPLVLITNASMFHRPHVQRALETLDKRCGEIWAKLDAGSPEYYARINRAPFSFEHILQNIREAVRLRPLVIQSLFMRIDGQAPPRSEWQAYCERLTELTHAGQLKLIQIYTIARPPAEAYVTPLSDVEVDELVAFVREQTGLPVSGYYGVSP
jgi:wyosine [tRNA(Phe)-imidazoG37] synthetase (radical SAM superfamily)